MPTFDSDGVVIAYDTAGSGDPIVLVHGFASSLTRNWKDTRWFETLATAGRRVVALDCRGHGHSAKPHHPAQYSFELMSGDVLRLMDHLGIEHADVMGYSMGGRIVTALLLAEPQRFTRAILGGVGVGVLGTRRDAEAIARALEVDDPRRITDPTGQAFRAFAEHGGNDVRALAACMRGLRFGANADLHRITNPVLVVVGEQDTLVGDPRPLVAQIPGAALVLVSGRDHLNTVGARAYKDAVLRFLAGTGSD